MKLWHAIANLNLIVLALDHLLTGLAGVFVPTRSAGLYRRLFGAQFPEGSPLTSVLRPWGALGVFTGIAGLLPVIDSLRYRPILYALVLLLVLRIFIRLTYDPATLTFFNLTKRRNYFHIFLVAQCAAIILLQLAYW